MGFVASLCGWLPSPPDVVHLYTGEHSLAELKTHAKLAFASPPPLQVGHSMIRCTGCGNQDGFLFWHHMDRAKAEPQSHMGRLVRSAGLGTLKQKERA